MRYIFWPDVPRPVCGELLILGKLVIRHTQAELGGLGGVPGAAVGGFVGSVAGAGGGALFGGAAAFVCTEFGVYRR